MVNVCMFLCRAPKFREVLLTRAYLMIRKLELWKAMHIEWLIFWLLWMKVYIRLQTMFLNWCLLWGLMWWKGNIDYLIGEFFNLFITGYLFCEGWCIGFDLIIYFFMAVMFHDICGCLWVSDVIAFFMKWGS